MFYVVQLGVIIAVGSRLTLRSLLIIRLLTVGVLTGRQRCEESSSQFGFR